MLPVHREIGFGDGIRAQHAVLPAGCCAPQFFVTCAARALDAAVDDEMRDVDILRAKGADSA
jgi:hypothetical protein